MQKTVSAVLCQLSLQLSLRLLGELCIISLMDRASHLGCLSLLIRTLGLFMIENVTISHLLYSSAFWLLSVTHFSLCTIYAFPFFTWVSFLAFCMFIGFVSRCSYLQGSVFWYFWNDLTCVSGRTNLDYISCSFSVPWLDLSILREICRARVFIYWRKTIFSLNFFPLTHNVYIPFLTSSWSFYIFENTNHVGWVRKWGRLS